MILRKKLSIAQILKKPGAHPSACNKCPEVYMDILSALEGTWIANF